MVVAGRRHPPRSGGPAVKRLAAGTHRLVPDALRRDPEDRWSAVFGRIAVYSFIVALISGVLLLPLFRPSMATVVYRGSYRLLDGATMSRAYQSVLAISFDVRGGLLIRQVHHWSADLFVAAVILRLLRVFFRGRFCGRARPDWLIWVALLPLGMLAAYTGTILPDDGLSGGSLGRDHRRAAVRAGDRDAPGVLRSSAVLPPGIRSSAATTGCTSWSSRSWPARCSWPASGRRCGGRAGYGPVRCCCSPARCWSCSARSRRSTRCGWPGRTSRAASAPARCRTGTWGSSTARCGSCRPGSCR